MTTPILPYIPSPSPSPSSTPQKKARRRDSLQKAAQSIVVAKRSVGIQLRSRRVLAILAVLSLGACFLYNTHDGGAAVEQLKEQRCRLIPWLKQCPPEARNPFSGLTWESADGFLSYPATTPTDEEPPQPHPIHLLLRNARVEWDAKVARQSKTLPQAVREYRKRYGMAPPKGFGQWFDFAKRNNVKLLDEYDSILERLTPFASLTRDVLQARSDMLQHDKTFWMHDMTFTIRGGMSADGPMRADGHRADQVLELMKGFAQYLPDLNITMTGHDVPWVVVAGEARIRHVEAAKAGKYIEDKYVEDYTENGALDGWAEDSMSRAITFIDKHVPSMDLCQHPERQGIHGFTAWPGPRPGLLFPLFSFTSTSLHSDILVPPLEQYEREVGLDPIWKEKTQNKLVWRGSTTGSDLTIPHMRKFSQRPRLCRLHKQTGSIAIPIASNDAPGELGPVTEYRVQAFDVADEYFDFQFMGRAQQCGDEAACKAFEREFEWDEFMTEEKQNKYRYVLDVDGNGWSGRFHRLMASNSLVFKSTIFPEWYSERIQPWVHYVPVSTDYQDVWSIMTFFRGDLDGQGSHDDIAEKLATEGKVWANEYWRWEDMQAYFFRQILEYARIMNRDPAHRTNMDYVD
ncbi:hypothetical protein RQP46_000996 [Phenoliferia psychrophenolica]